MNRKAEMEDVNGIYCGIPSNVTEGNIKLVRVKLPSDIGSIRSTD